MTSAADRKLDSGQLNILQLIRKQANAEGWAIVSLPIYRGIFEAGHVPRALAEWEWPEGAEKGRARLTPEGVNVLDAQAWLR